MIYFGFLDLRVHGDDSKMSPFMISVYILYHNIAF